MSLVSLAEQKNLPLHQYMDKETVNWIAANNIFRGEESVSLSKISFEYLKQYIPPDNWFLNADTIEGIHGLRHLLRVGIHSLVISTNISGFALNLKNLLIVAVLHDIRREHDKDDEKHGKHAAMWFLNNSGEISEYFGVAFSNNDKEEIYSAIYYHGLPYEKFEKEGLYLRNRIIVDFLKTADALDRYRLPKLKWWFNPEMVKIIPSREVMVLAYNLVLESERKHLNGLSNVDSVMQSL